MALGPLITGRCARGSAPTAPGGAASIAAPSYLAAKRGKWNERSASGASRARSGGSPTRSAAADSCSAVRQPSRQPLVAAVESAWGMREETARKWGRPAAAAAAPAARALDFTARKTPVKKRSSTQGSKKVTHTAQDWRSKRAGTAAGLARGGREFSAAAVAASSDGGINDVPTERGAEGGGGDGESGGDGAAAI